MKKIILPSKICEACFELYNRKYYLSGRLQDVTEYENSKYCSHKCFTNHNRGENHPNWNDGIRGGHEGGYLRYTDGSYIHRVIMENYLGRPLTSNEHIHHINGDPSDNRIENLELHSNSSHRKFEASIAKRDEKGRFCNV